MMRMLTTNSDSAEGMDQNRNASFDSFLEPLPEVTVQPSVGDSKAEREQRSLALEKTYVYDVYEQIAPHVIESRHKPWPKIKQFLVELEPGSLVCDVGCGNGKYLDINPDVYKIGSDQCSKLVEGANEQGHDVLVCDNMALPFREEAFDAVLSIAVVHHFATTERRVQALRELARILRIGGRLMITAWALEQRHRKFESQDVLVPWHKPVRSSSEDQTSLDKEITSTTTSDDDLLNYHAYTSGMESEPYFVPTCYPRRKHKLRDGGWTRGHRGRNLDSRHSSSQSSSDLSSPNETCYSFVRRALQKLSSSKTWDDPHQRCRPPWFLQSVDSAINANGSESGRSSEKQDSLDSNENADDIPIELHDVDSEIYEESELTEQKKCKESRKYSLQQNSWKNCQSAKYLKRSSSSNSAPPSMGGKSKSLSDILSLFTVNFSYSRKSSQDSTSSSSLTKQSSSQSSVDSKGKHGRSSHHQNRPSNGVVRSKSSHFTLAKVDEDIEQNPPPPTASATSLPQQFSARTAAPQKRWSVAGYPSSSKPPGGSECGGTKRPQSLVLGQEVRIPRTLSSEDHKNGNTILPDLDSCLSFYGLTTGMKSDFLSPPYTKAEAGLNEEAARNNRKENSCKTDLNKNDKNDWLTCNKCNDVNAKGSEIKKSIQISSEDVSDVSRDVVHSVCQSNDRGLTTRNLACKKLDCFRVAASVRKDTCRDLFYGNLIKQIIDREHLFPYHSMPNLSNLRTSDFLEEMSKSKAGQGGRRFSQPHGNFRQIGALTKRNSECGIFKETVRNGFKHRSFSMDVNGRQTLAGSNSLDGMAANPVPKNRCLIRRRSSCACNCKGGILPIKHSFSAGDSTFHSFTNNALPNHAVKIGNNKIIAKEDSLQSDTSVDSDDSVASVIAVRRRSSVDTNLRDSERHCSTCSKDSSNLSDTSVDSEDSCVSVIAMPIKQQDILANKESSTVDTLCQQSSVSPTSNYSAADLIAATEIPSPRVKLRCCRQKSLELDDFMPENKLDLEVAETINTNDCDPAINPQDSFPEESANAVSAIKLTISWEKYLDACESFVLDSIFYVNADYAGEPVGIAQLLPNICEDYENTVADVQYLDSQVPLTAETCFLDSTSSWKSSESFGEASEVEDLPSLSEDQLNEELKLDICDQKTDERELSPSLFPPGSPQGRLLEAAVDVANSLQSAVSVAARSCQSEHPETKTDACSELIFFDNTILPVPAPSKREISNLELEDVNSSGHCDNISTNPLIQIKINPSTHLEILENDEQTSDEGFQKLSSVNIPHNGVETACSNKEPCSSTNTPLRNEEVGLSEGSTVVSLHANSPEHSNSSLSMFKLTSSTMQMCVEVENVIKVDEELANASKSRNNGENGSKSIFEMHELSSLNDKAASILQEITGSQSNLPRESTEWTSRKDEVVLSSENRGFDIQAASPERSNSSFLMLEKVSFVKEICENIENVRRMEKDVVDEVQAVSKDGNDSDDIYGGIESSSLNDEASSILQEVTISKIGVATDFDSKLLHESADWPFRKEEIGFSGENRVTDFQATSSECANLSFLIQEKASPGKNICENFENVLRMEEDLMDEVQAENSDVIGGIKLSSLKDERDDRQASSPGSTNLSFLPLEKTSSANEMCFENTNGLQSMNNEENDSEGVLGGLDLSDLKDERHRQVCEDVINGNVPGHRELLKKMVEEWGQGWLEFRSSGAISVPPPGGEKKRRKSESEAIDSNVHSDSQVSNSRNQIVRGKSMEFNSTSCRLLTGGLISRKHSGCDAAVKLSTSVQYQIQEEEESMSKSNDSSEFDTRLVKDAPVGKKVSTETDLMQTSMASSIENHFGNLEFLAEAEGPDGNNPGEALGLPSQDELQTEDEVQIEVDNGQEGGGRPPDSLSLSTSEDSILSGSENGGSTTYHRFYHVFREGELDHLIEKYVENLHIISSYYDHANWCIIAEKVQVWRI